MKEFLVSLQKHVQNSCDYFAEGIGPRTASRGASSVAESPAAANAVGSGKATLRLRSKGPLVVETEEVLCCILVTLNFVITSELRTVKKTTNFPQ